jgi:HTH-type transcriptional regulator/antitoxin HigA
MATERTAHSDLAIPPGEYLEEVIAELDMSKDELARRMRLGELEARKSDCAAFDRKRLTDPLPALRAMTGQAPQVFLPALSSLLAETGVALIICPHFPGTRVHGAVFWPSRGKAALMMTIRGAWANVFWFSLFHELGHILLHGRREVILENDDADPMLQAREDEADQFADDSLIPPDDYLRFVASGGFSGAGIEAFASRIGIDPGVVVGRLQHDGHLKHEWRNELRTRYTWAATAQELR